MGRSWVPVLLTIPMMAACATTVAPAPKAVRPKVAAASPAARPTKTLAPETDFARPSPTPGFLHSSPDPRPSPRATPTPLATATPTPAAVPAHDDRAALKGEWGIVGRVTKGGTPLAGRVVVLRSQVSFGKEPEIARATTDADGLYVLAVPAAAQHPDSGITPSFAVTYNRDDTSPVDGSHAGPLGEGEFRAFATDEHKLEPQPQHQEQVDFDLAWNPPDMPIAADATVVGPTVDFGFARKRFPSLGLVVWQGKTLDAGQRVCDSVTSTGNARWSPSCTGKPDGAGLPPGDYLYHVCYFDYDQKATSGAYLAYSTPWIPFQVKGP